MTKMKASPEKWFRRKGNALAGISNAGLRTLCGEMYQFDENLSGEELEALFMKLYGEL